MLFEWNEQKRRQNLRKHGIDFRDGKSVFSGPLLTMLDDRVDYLESRFVTFGLLGGRVVAVAHTEANNTIRIISMRRATRHEHDQFFKAIEDRFKTPR